MMEAGKLDREIVVERLITTLDEFGGEVTTWSPLATVPAEVNPISDGERFRAGQIGAQVTHRFRIRWGIGVKPTDRVLYDGLVFELHGVKEVGRREGQELTGQAEAD